MSAGYQVNPDALKETGKGINDAINELKSIGIAESGEIGRGFSNISLSGMQVGHEGLQQAFDDFCERWSWGVRTLVQDGNEIAQRLHLAAGEYHDLEQYGAGVFKDLAGDLVADPHKTDEQFEKGSWGDIGHDANPLNADYSAASFKKLGTDASKTWRTEARDLSEGPDILGHRPDELLPDDMRKKVDAGRDQLFGHDTKPPEGDG